MKTYNKITSLAAAAFVLAGTSLSAATVLIDWSDNQTAPSPDTNGNYWNTLGASGVGNDFTATPLTASNNTASGWSVAATVDFNSENNTGTGFGGAGIDGPVGATSPFDTTGTNRPTVDGLYANYNANGTAVITFTGLTPNFQYDFSAIGGRASGGVNGFIKVITGAFGAGGSDVDLLETTGGTGKYADDDLLDTFSLLNDGTILDFSVTSDGSGSIAFDFFEGQNDTDGGSNSTFNALSMTAVPEPSAFALLAGMFSLTWVMLKRRSARS